MTWCTFKGHPIFVSKTKPKESWEQQEEPAVNHQMVLTPVTFFVAAEDTTPGSRESQRDVTANSNGVVMFSVMFAIQRLKSILVNDANQVYEFVSK